MKATRFANRAWAFVLAVLMTLTLIAPQALAANTVDPVKPAGNKIVVSQTDYTLVEGVTESDIFLNTKEGNAQIAGFMTTIAPGAKATFKASYNGYYTEGSTPASRKDKAANLAWSMERTTQQAANYVKATGGNVIMAMNGDYYNMQTLQPLGYLIMEGNLIQKNNGIANEPYFAVLKDGSYAIRDAGVDCSDGLEAISGNHYGGNHRNMSVEEETAILAPFKERAEKGELVEVSEIAQAYQAAVDHPVSNGQIYFVLHRHGWRKVMPRSKHPRKASDEEIAASKKLTPQ